MVKISINLYKIRSVLDFIRRQGKLPTDANDQILCPRDMIAWFSLKECLNINELSYIEEELVGLIEAEKAIEQLRLSNHQ
ncbi:hypothetical protein ACFL6U_14490 [Planctomycetota bacterium]